MFTNSITGFTIFSQFDSIFVTRLQKILWRIMENRGSEVNVLLLKIVSFEAAIIAFNE